MDQRRDELATNLVEVRERIRRAAESADRDPANVTLVVVTKTWPAADVRLLAELGVQHVGENRDQEAAPKAAELTDLAITWHFIGQLQTNKARSVATYADIVESVDRVRLVHALDAAAGRADRHLDVLAQVVLDVQPGRGGATASDVDEVAEAIASAEWLRLRGVMAVAPLDVDPLRAFQEVRRIADHVAETYPEAEVMSAGMSGDLEQAVACGATHVRVGSAVLGHRPPVR